MFFKSTIDAVADEHVIKLLGRSHSFSFTKRSNIPNKLRAGLDSSLSLPARVRKSIVQSGSYIIYATFANMILLVLSVTASRGAKKMPYCLIGHSCSCEK